jgi:hypothetical protein
MEKLKRKEEALQFQSSVAKSVMYFGMSIWLVVLFAIFKALSSYPEIYDVLVNPGK